MHLLLAYCALYILRAASGALALAALVLLAVVTYRLLFHPLHQIPGPRLAAVSNIWHAYHARNGQMYRLGKDLHQRYGSVVRVGPNEVWFDSKEAFRAIYGSHSRTFAVNIG